MAVDPTAPTQSCPPHLSQVSLLGESAGMKGEAGVGPYKLAMRRLRRNKTALAFGALFLLIVRLCLFAARSGPSTSPTPSRPRTT